MYEDEKKGTEIEIKIKIEIERSRGDIEKR